MLVGQTTSQEVMAWQQDGQFLCISDHPTFHPSNKVWNLGLTWKNSTAVIAHNSLTFLVDTGYESDSQCSYYTTHFHIIGTDKTMPNTHISFMSNFPKCPNLSICYLVEQHVNYIFTCMVFWTHFSSSRSKPCIHHHSGKQCQVDYWIKFSFK